MTVNKKVILLFITGVMIFAISAGYRIFEGTATYVTRYGELSAVTCPQFQFEYPKENWEIKMEETDTPAFSEKDTIANKNGVEITYIDFAMVDGMGNEGRFDREIVISKVADSSFIPGIPDGTGMDYSCLGKFMVAKVEFIGELYMDEDVEMSPIENGEILYAVLPESYVGKYDVIGRSGLYTQLSFYYPAAYAFIAEGVERDFSQEEIDEVINILASFRPY